MKPWRVTLSRKRGQNTRAIMESNAKKRWQATPARKRDQGTREATWARRRGRRKWGIDMKARAGAKKQGIEVGLAPAR